MWRKGLVGAACAAAMIRIGPADAADKPTYKPPAVALPASAVPPLWTGFYLGSHIGGLFGNKVFTNNFPVPTGVIDANPSVRGWLSGFQAGYNYQVNWLVLGVEGEFTWSRVRSGFPCFDFGDQVCSADPEWVATLAGRIGAAFGPALFYVKGGAAWVHDFYSNIATCSGNQSRGDISAFCGDLFVASETRPGWIVGVGAEYRFMPNWSVKVEYDYLRFGERSIFFRDDEGNFFSELIRQDMHMVKVGVNYRFGEWDSAPLSAYANAAPGPSRRSRSSSKPTSSTDDKDDDDDESSNKILASTGLDVGKYTLDGWVSGLLAPWNDLNTSGPRVYIYGSSGLYKYFDEGTTFRGTYSVGDVLAGYGFEGDNYSINVLGGVRAANHMISPFDPENKVQGTAIGVQARIDAYANPTPYTMAYGEAEYSTAFGEFYTAGKFGFDVTNGKEIFVGPMAAYFGDPHFNQWRIGAHVSHLKFGSVQVDVAAGYAKDSTVGTGAFGYIELSTHLN